VSAPVTEREHFLTVIVDRHGDRVHARHRVQVGVERLDHQLLLADQLVHEEFLAAEDRQRSFAEMVTLALDTLRRTEGSRTSIHG